MVRSGSRLCALPLSTVRETMRPLPCDPLPDMPGYVLGLSRIRGKAVPVIDLSRLLDDTRAVAGRLVSLRLGDRSLALAVQSVLDVLELETGTLSRLPSLFSSSRAEVVQSIGERDSELVLVLDAARMLDAELWDRLEAHAETL